MKKHIVTSFLISSILLTSCGKNTEKVIYKTSNPVTSGTDLSKDSGLLKDWQEIFLNGHTSVQIAELLASEVVAKDRASVLKVLQEFSDEELKEIIKELKNGESKLRNNYFHYNEDWANNVDLLDKTIIGKANQTVNPYALGNRIVVTVAASAKDKLLKEISEAYNSRVNTLAKEIAPTMAKAIAEENPEAVKEIEASIKNGDNEEAQKKISAVVKGLKAYDNFFKNSGLNDQEQALLTVSGVTAGAIGYAIYEQVKEKKTFNKILKLAKKVKEVHEDLKEILVLAKSLDTYAKAMEEDVKEFKTASSEIATDVSNTFNEIQEEGIKTNIDSRKTFDYLYKKTIGAKVEGKPSSGSIATKTWKIDTNVKTMVNSAQRISSNFNLILQTSQEIAGKLGIKLPDEIVKLADKAQKVNAGLQLANKVLNGLASGGIMGAVQAFAGGGGASLLGGGISFEGRVMSEFNNINKKLDAILELQKQMIDLQIKTLETLQKMALLMDQYHQEEMAAIASLRNISLVDLEISKSEFNEGIRNCEMLMSFQISKMAKGELLKRPGMDAAIAEMTSQTLFEQFKGFIGTQSFIKGTTDVAYEKCQDGISNAFANNRVNENPILSIYSTTDDNDLKAFNDRNYLPILKLVNAKKKKKSWSSMALHAPIYDVKDIGMKNLVMSQGSYKTNAYSIDYLISPAALERYAVQLLILHPYLELDKSDWEQSSKKIFESYASFSEDSSKSRSMYMLKNALSFTQAAIAQEALLAGEPVLDSLREKLGVIFAGKNACQDYTGSLGCAVRTNPILLHNLILYIVQQSKMSGLGVGEYRLAYESKNVKQLEKIIFDNKVNGAINENLEIVLDEKTNMKLPLPEEIEAGLIVYSEQMGRLVRLQDKLLDALVKITPTESMAQTTKEKLSSLILSKYL